MVFKRFITYILLTMMFATSCVFAAKNSIAESFSPEKVKAIESIVHDYLVKNPEVLIEASRSLRQMRTKQLESLALAAVKENRERIFSDPNSPIEGKQASHLALVEFFDYRCGHCREMRQTIRNLLINNPTLKVIYKVLPILGKDSVYAAQAALVAYRYGKFKSVHEALLSAEPLSQENVITALKAADVNMNRVNVMLTGKRVQSELKNNAQLAGAMRLGGTPAFIIANLRTNKYRFIFGAASQSDLQAALNSVR
jgi:protein-disulfide isomerase